MATVNGTSRAQGKADWKRLGWKVGLAAAVIAAGYGAWFLIPLVVKSDFAPYFKTALIAVLGATLLLPAIGPVFPVSAFPRPNLGGIVPTSK